MIAWYELNTIIHVQSWHINYNFRSCIDTEYNLSMLNWDDIIKLFFTSSYVHSVYYLAFAFIKGRSSCTLDFVEIYVGISLFFVAPNIASIVNEWFRKPLVSQQRPLTACWTAKWNSFFNHYLPSFRAG